MADKRIQDLTPATSVQTIDRFVLEQSGQAKSLTGEVLIRDLATALDGHGGISEISYTAPTGTSLDGTMTVTLADGTAETFTVTNGKGISSITKTSTSNLTDTYTISYNNGTTSTFSVKNGRGIDGISKESSGLTDTYTIEYNDGTESVIVLDNGNGIESIDITYAIANQGTNPYAIVTWYTTPVAPTADNQYQWTRFQMTDKLGVVTDAYSVACRADAPTINVGSVTSTSGANVSASVTNSGTEYNPTFDFAFVMEKGDKGDTGDYIDPVVSYGTSTAAATEPITWYSSPSSLSYSSGNFIWQKTEYTLHEAQTVQSTEKKIIGYIGQNGSGSGTVSRITFNNEVFSDDGTGNVNITVDAEDVGAIAEPSSKSNGQVLTYDSTAGEWVATTPSTGNVNTVNNVGVTVGTTNIQLYGTAIPMSSTDNRSVQAAIPLASSTTPSNLGTAAVGTGTTWARADHVHEFPTASEINAVSNLRGTAIPSNADLNTYLTPGSYYIGNATIAATITNNPYTLGNSRVDVVQGGSTSYTWQIMRCTGNGTLWIYLRRYEASSQTFTEWVRLLNTTDLPISVANGGTGATDAATARDNLGLGTSSDINAIANQRGTAISSNADLNSYTTPGCYYCLSGTVAVTLSNTPITGGNFRLEVVGAGSTNYSTYVVQFAYGTANNDVFVRKLQGTWTSWGRLLDSTTDLPISIANGGTGATDAATALDNLGLGGVGARVTTEPSAVSVASGTETSVASISLSAGVWVVNCTVRFASNATGYRRATIKHDGTNWISENAASPAIDGTYTWVNIPMNYKLTATTSIELFAYQNSGSALSCYGRIYATRII